MLRLSQDLPEQSRGILALIRVPFPLMELTRAEIDAMLRRADEARTKLRRATRELQRFGEEAMAARDGKRPSDRQRDRR